MRPIDYIIFDITGWNLLEVKKLEKRWMSKSNSDQLSVNLFEERPDFAADLSDIPALKQQTLDSIKQFNGEVAEIRSDTLDEIPAFRVIIKIPQKQGGYTYIGSYTLPFQESSYAIKVQCAEMQNIGQRESTALHQLISSKTLDLDITSSAFSANSITPEMEALISKTSDSTALDVQLPYHPLTRARNTLDHIQQTIELNPILKKRTPFKFE